MDRLFAKSFNSDQTFTGSVDGVNSMDIYNQYTLQVSLLNISDLGFITSNTTMVDFFRS